MKSYVRKITTKIKSRLILFKNINHFDGTKKLLCEGTTHFIFGNSSRIIINGILVTGHNSYGKDRNISVIRLDDDSRIEINGETQIFYGADIVVFRGGVLKIGNSFINSDCKIRVTDRIEIGDGCAISHDFTIMDSNQHRLNGEIKKGPIIIEDNVWIGTRVTILPGIRIGKGAVIGAGAVVTSDIPPRALVAGVPARIIKRDVNWSEN